MTSIKSVPFNQAMNQAPRTIVDALRVKHDGGLPKVVSEQDMVELKGIFKPDSREAKFLSTQLMRFFASANATASANGAVVGMMTKADAATAGAIVAAVIGAVAGK